MLIRWSKTTIPVGHEGLFLQVHLHIFNLPSRYSEEAAWDLASLKISQSNRGPDPREPSRIITTTTTRLSPTFSMTREIVKATC